MDEELGWWPPLWLPVLVVGMVLGRLLLRDVPLGKGLVPRDYFAHGDVSPRRFLLTGCGSGVGRHLAGVLLKQGHSVIATDVNVEALQDLLGRDSGKIEVMKLDVTKREDWEAAVELAREKFGALDVVMNIAGFLHPGKIQDDNTARYIDLHVDVNVTGVINGTCLMSRFMIESIKNGELEFGGHIINIASIAAKSPVSGLTLYSATKYACRGFSLCAAKDLYHEGVFVTVVCPDAIRTPMLDLQVSHDDAALTFSGMTTLTVEDIERAILDDILINRPREVILASDPTREYLTVIGDAFSDSRLVAFFETIMRAKGRSAQKVYSKVEKSN